MSEPRISSLSYQLKSDVTPAHRQLKLLMASFVDSRLESGKETPKIKVLTYLLLRTSFHLIIIIVLGINAPNLSTNSICPSPVILIPFHNPSQDSGRSQGCRLQLKEPLAPGWFSFVDRLLDFLGRIRPRLSRHPASVYLISHPHSYLHSLRHHFIHSLP